MIDPPKSSTTSSLVSEHQSIAKTSTPETLTITPTLPGQRMLVSDIIRGFAIFGILLVNMALFNHSFYSQALGLDHPTGILDQLAQWGITFFAEGEFYAILAFLFGLSMAIQYRRFQQSSQHFVAFYLRRLAVLLLIGLIHAYLFWVGDILMLYAVLGIILLLLFRNRKPKSLLIWSGIFLLIPILLNVAMYAMIEFVRMSPNGAATIDTAVAAQTQQFQAASDQADHIYANGSYAEVTQQRAQDMRVMYASWPFLGCSGLAMMLLGLYVGQRQLLEHRSDQLPFIRRVWRWGLILGVIGNLIYVVAGESVNRSIPSPQLLVMLIGQTIGAPALSLFYISSLVLLVQHPAWQSRLQGLTKVGRMAISNYLLQTVICTTLFYGYGFGFYGQVDSAMGVLLTIAIYTVQIFFSIWWLSRFRFGPVEWCWRSLSYGQRQPLRYSTQS